MKDRQNAIKTYLQKEQRGKEANRLEREALSDSFLYEALEGLTAVEGDHIKIIEGLNRRIAKTRIHGSRCVGNYWWIAVACLVIVVVAWKLLYVPVDEPLKLVAVPQLMKDSMMMHVEESVADRQDSLQKFQIAEGVAENQGKLIIKEAVVAERESTDRLMVSSDLKKEIVDTGQVFFYASAKSKKEIRPMLSDSSLILLKSHKVNSFLKKAEIAKIKVAERFEERDDWYVSFERYVVDSLRYPEEAASKGVEGEVVLSLNFNRKGKLGRIKIIRKLHPACDREAVRLVKEYSGSWGINEKNVLVTLPFLLKN